MPYNWSTYRCYVSIVFLFHFSTKGVLIDSSLIDASIFHWDIPLLLPTINLNIIWLNVVLTLPHNTEEKPIFITCCNVLKCFNMWLHHPVVYYFSIFQSLIYIPLCYQHKSSLFNACLKPYVYVNTSMTREIPIWLYLLGYSLKVGSKMKMSPT